MKEFINLDDLNGIQFGILLIILGIIFIWLPHKTFKKFKNEKFNPFKRIKRENNDDYFNDALNIFLFCRSFFMIIIGYLLVFGGIIIMIIFPKGYIN